MHEKTCSVCACTFYDDDVRANFNAHPQTADGLRPDCKTCQAIDNDIYYDRNRFAILDKRYEDYHANIEEKRAYFAQKARERRTRQRDALQATA
mgnify:FL=1|jgi:hypothetical protein